MTMLFFGGVVEGNTIGGMEFIAHSVNNGDNG